MPTVSVRVDEETKHRMDELNVNWSAVLREHIDERIEESKDRDLAQAVLLTEQTRRSVDGWNSTDEIRRWRDERGRR